jgi:hypothetical protein
MLFVSSAEDMWLKEEFEDTKEVIRICNSEKDRKNNGQKGKGQRNKQQSTKHWVTSVPRTRIARTPWIS